MDINRRADRDEAIRNLTDVSGYLSRDYEDAVNLGIEALEKFEEADDYLLKYTDVQEILENLTDSIEEGQEPQDALRDAIRELDRKCFSWG